MKKFFGLKSTVVAVALLTASSAYADTANRTAAVNIIDSAITISTTSDMDFGTVVKPASGESGYVVIDEDGIVSDSDNLELIDSSRQGGEYEVSGADNAVSVTITGSTSGGLTIGDFTGEYDGNTISGTGNTVTLSGVSGPDGSVDLVLGGKLTLDNTSDAVSDGAQTVAYSIDIQYD